MKDAFGTVLSAGDFVLHARSRSGGGVAFQRGTIREIRITHRGEAAKIQWERKEELDKRAGDVLGHNLVLLTTKEEQEA